MYSNRTARSSHRCRPPVAGFALAFALSLTLLGAAPPVPARASEDPPASQTSAAQPGRRPEKAVTPDAAAQRQRSEARRIESWKVRGIDPRAPSPLSRTQTTEFWQAVVGATNADHLFTDLDYLSTQLQTRYYSTPQMEQACNYVYDELASLGLDTSFDVFTYNGHTIKNVLAVKPGTVDPDRIYVIVGHLDSISPNPTSLAPGADDNGTGSMAVLEAARLLAPLPADYTIYFLCVTAEEAGLIGSEHFAAEADQLNLDIRGVLDLDMVGWYDPAGADLWIEGFHQGVSSVWLMDQVAANAQAYAGLSVYLYPGEGWGSDHEPFHDHGYPAMLSIENEWDSYPCYHRTCDTVDQLNGPFWSKITATNVITLGQLAQVQGDVGSIAGTVTLGDGASPAGAICRLLGVSLPERQADAEGAFSWTSVFPTTFTLEVQMPGYVTSTVDVTVPSGGVAQVDVVLDPLLPGTVAGMVRDAAGAPVPNASIEVEGQSEVAVSGPDGTYILPAVYPGTLNLSAAAQGMTPRGARVTLAAGETLNNVDFVLETVWDVQDSSEGLTSSGGWEWGTDAIPGAHSGTRVWGTVLGGNYASCADYRLEFPAVSLISYEDALLRVWIWYKTQATRDGGNLQISTDGGSSWSLVPPDAGYGSNCGGSCNVLAGEDAYTGNSAVWMEKTFSLNPWLGQWVRLRFRFGSNSSTQDRGWYLDDLSLEGTVTPPSDLPAPPESGSSPAARAPALLSVRPNPARGRAEILLSLSRTAEGVLSIHAADGRQIARLNAPEVLTRGDHPFTWDGRSANGLEAPAGVYWVRFDGRTANARRALVLLR